MKISALVLPLISAQSRNFDGHLKLTIEVDGDREDIEQKEKVFKNFELSYLVRIKSHKNFQLYI